MSARKFFIRDDEPSHLVGERSTSNPVSHPIKHSSISKCFNLLSRQSNEYLQP